MASGNEITELVQLVQGYKMFMGVIAGAFSFILMLLLYIWGTTLKNNNKRHEASEKLLSKAMDNQAGIQRIVDRHDVEIEHLKND